MPWLTSLALLSLVLSAVDPKTTRPSRPRPVVVRAERPTTPFECDTAKAAEWYGTASRCREALCSGWNATSAYVGGPDGRLRRNPCYFDPRE